jgi:hypothetical protein
MQLKTGKFSIAPDKIVAGELNIGGPQSSVILRADELFLRIPADGGQGFQINVDTDSSATWTEFRRDGGQFLE